MRYVISCVAIAAFLVAGIWRADARVVVSVDKSTQRMSVAVDGFTRHVWDVSTGRDNFGTPTGVFKPEVMERIHFSRKYYDSPMPYSIFFHRGYAIHGSYEISRLGGPASHGCIRLHPQNAATLFFIVRQHGAAATTIIVSGNNPSYASRSALREAKYERAVEADVSLRSDRRRYRDVTPGLMYKFYNWKKSSQSPRY
jgi:hypothetical protein